MFRWRSLCNAVESGNLERMQFLVGWIKSQMTWIGIPDKNFAQLLSYVLFVAIIRGQSDIAIFAVEQRADVHTFFWLHQLSQEFSHIDSSCGTPLVAAIKYGDFDVTRCLLEKGADRDKATDDGNTPLHWAARSWKFPLEITMLLMSYGADLNARNKDGQLPIDMVQSEEVKQAICDEQIRRMDHGFKRAVEQDWHPIADTAAIAAQQEDDDDDDDESSDEDDENDD